jgi:uncharacterized protein YifN (PemK superfamily)
MSLPRLMCPNDASHTEFRGRVCAFTQYDADLDRDRNVLSRKNPLDSNISDPSGDAIFCVACNLEIWSRPRGITFFPTEGTVLICDFTGGFRPPEMIEKRPCVVISPKDSNRSTCVIVPISSQESRNSNAIVVPMPMARYTFLRKDGWAKCHMPATVSITRLSLMRDPQTGRGIDTRSTMLRAADLAAVRQGVARFVGVITGAS